MKKTNENLVILITLFAISIVIANVTGARTITTGLHTPFFYFFTRNADRR